jgi:hypothetical protein
MKWTSSAMQPLERLKALQQIVQQGKKYVLREKESL